MTGHEEFSDEEAAVFFECEEREAALRKALRCSDPELRDLAVAQLKEEAVQAMARFANELLEHADKGEVALTDEYRQKLLEAIEVAVDRPDWYRPGDRVVLPDE